MAFCINLRAPKGSLLAHLGLSSYRQASGHYAAWCSAMIVSHLRVFWCVRCDDCVTRVEPALHRSRPPVATLVNGRDTE
eukprot:291253-Prorocentrum_minimum.AAC.1